MTDDLDLDARLARRRALASGGAALIGLAASAWMPAARAQAFPSRPLRMMVAFPTGGATDILARALGQRLSTALGQPVVVENRPGAGGLIGLEAAAKAQPDGHGVFLCALTNQAIATHLYPKANVHIARDFEPVSLLANGAHMLNVHPSVPARTVNEFAAWLKANDGRINYASQGNGTLSHLESELLAQRLGVKLVHIPYKGSSNALPDLIAGNVSFMFDSVAASMTHVRSGALRGLAVAASRRVPAFPDLPTIAEAGVPGYDADNWFGLFVPKGTPRAAIAALDAAVAGVMKEPELEAMLVQQGYVPGYANPARLAEVATQEIDKWGRVVKSANVSVS